MRNIKTANLLETGIVDGIVDVVENSTSTNCYSSSNNSHLNSLHSSIIDKLSSPSRSRKQLQ